ncbi:hypothetical protein [Saccharothrix variisporea]|uniref:Uncharacterized protein n=1 Tax=Saccharothrix variisporea TaxID=543527 RepID=A0A495XHT8_9PSEU|nr:hypothetical protein [Saccharothrix variisporea]RKT72716.1 hypothetical protein DFJ66_6040 [Saccharothrix variisporea]
MDDYLGIYLRDQLALGVGWRELARRSWRNNRGTALGEALAEVAEGIAQDVETFRSIMGRLGVRTDPVRTTLAVVGERLGRFKPNGRLLTYSPLSRFLELEALTMGIDRKKQLWHTLADLADLRTRLPDVDFDELVARAERQRQRLEPFRRQVGARTFTAEQPRG